MESEIDVPQDSVIDADDLDPGFASEVRQRSGVEFSACYHCSGCVGVCHFSHAMDYPPNRMVRLIQLGMRKEALGSSAIWLCVGCNTCSHHCPMRVDMPAIMDALRQMAIEEGVTPAEPNVLHFHRDLLRSVKRYGRTHKLEIMVRYKIRNLDFFSDMGVGAKLFTRGKIDVIPSRTKAIDQVRAAFDADKGDSRHE